MLFLRMSVMTLLAIMMTTSHWSGLARAQDPERAIDSKSKLLQLANIVSCESIAKFSPRARADLVCVIARAWNEAQSSGIDSELRIQHFFSEIAAETGGMTVLSENMDYSEARILHIFATRVDKEHAVKLAHHPEQLANYVYNGRNGNHDTGDDGWTYRGGGLIQVTGRGNYQNTGVTLGMGNRLEAHPELLRTPGTAFSTAVAFWKNSNANVPADKDSVDEVRQAVNGGGNGLADVKIWLIQAKKAFKTQKLSVAGEEASARDEMAAVLEELQELGIVSRTLTLRSDNTQIVTEGLKHFQEERGLSQTGVLDEDTLYAITDPQNRVRE